jgi:predicted PolB exonuclease-like 3'-5' exonuclease
VTISNVFAFDIETVPDVEFGRRLHGLDGLSDKQVGYVMQTRQREQTGSEFLSLEQHRVVAISVAMRTRDGFKVWSLPVLHYRGLRHCVQAPRYWETGDEEQAFRWNNYISRFHWRHVDLMDVLSGFQGRGRVALDRMAQLLGLPGKLGMSGEGVWEAYLEGRIEDIRNYCETDVLNTYLIYLRFELMRGRLTPEEHGRECDLVRSSLRAAGRPHIDAFLTAWSAEAG